MSFCPEHICDSCTPRPFRFETGASRASRQTSRALQRKTTCLKWHFNALDGRHRNTLWLSVSSLFITFCRNKWLPLPSIDPWPMYTNYSLSKQYNRYRNPFAEDAIHHKLGSLRGNLRSAIFATRTCTTLYSHWYHHSDKSSWNNILVVILLTYFFISIYYHAYKICSLHSI